MNDDIQKLVEFINKHLTEHLEWFKDYREMYFRIMTKWDLYKTISDKEIKVLVIAYNKIFNKLYPLHNCQDLPFKE